MVRIVPVLIALFAWHAAVAGELRSEFFSSPASGRPMRYSVYLPDGYAQSKLHYPVLYLLHGAGGDDRCWQDAGHIKEKTGALIASGAIPPAIVVMPSCPACWWVDGAKERAETAFWSDLVPLVDLRYRTIETREGRLIAGLSAGGYGAVRFALRHADKVAAIAALSPAVYSGPVPQTSLARQQPPFLGLDGKFDSAAWEKLNYPALLDAYVAQPYRVPVYLLSGNRDRLGIAQETGILFERLNERQPGKAELHIVEGDHNWEVWEPAIGGAIRYLFQYAAKPRPATQSAGVKDAVLR
jgi:enterochelin esterase-like enzyme